MMKRYEDPAMKVVVLFNSDIVTDLGPVNPCSTLSDPSKTDCPVDDGTGVISGDATLPTTPAL